MGRSSTRHGSAAVFGGPVMRWNKKYVRSPLPTTAAAPTARGNHGDAVNRHPEEPPCRKFRYVLIEKISSWKIKMTSCLWNVQLTIYFLDQAMDLVMSSDFFLPLAVGSVEVSAFGFSLEEARRCWYCVFPVAYGK